MNIKITKEQHDYLCKLPYKEYIFGSQLHGISNAESDWDYIRVISDDFYKGFEGLGIYLPNIHSWQADLDDNSQVVWMTRTQFYRNLFSGDGNMIADVVLLSGKFSNVLFLCRTYKICKGYLGVAKRDLKMHGNSDKKKFHALRSIYMAQALMENKLPTVDGIKLLYKNYSGLYLPEKERLMTQEANLRNELNDMLNKKEISMYPQFKEENSLIQTMIDSNNLTEFKY